MASRAPERIKKSASNEIEPIHTVEQYSESLRGRNLTV